MFKLLYANNQDCPKHFTLYSLVGLFNRTLSRSLWGAYSHAIINARRLFVHTYPPLSIAMHSFTQLSELEQCIMKTLAQCSYSNLLIRECEAVPLCHNATINSFLTRWFLLYVSTAEWVNKITFRSVFYLLLLQPISTTTCWRRPSTGSEPPTWRWRNTGSGIRPVSTSYLYDSCQRRAVRFVFN